VDPSLGLGVAVFCSIARTETKSWAVASPAALTAAACDCETLRTAVLVGAFLVGFELGALVRASALVGTAELRLRLSLLGVSVGDLVRGLLGALVGATVGGLDLRTGGLLGDRVGRTALVGVGVLALGLELGVSVGVGAGAGAGGTAARLSKSRAIAPEMYGADMEVPE